MFWFLLRCVCVVEAVLKRGRKQIGRHQGSSGIGGEYCNPAHRLDTAGYREKQRHLHEAIAHKWNGRNLAQPLG